MSLLTAEPTYGEYDIQNLQRLEIVGDIGKHVEVLYLSAFFPSDR